MANIALTNGVKWASNSVVHQTIPTLFGINTSNVLYTNSQYESAVSWTATADCWVRVYCYNDYNSWCTINNVQVAWCSSGAYTICFPVKKGQVIAAGSANRYGEGAIFKAFGVKS